MRIKEKLELSGAVWRLSFSALFKKPIIVLPLAIAAIINALGLTVLYYYPRRPFSILAGPILKYFHRAHYLHYPANFLFLDKLSNYLTLFLGIIFVSLLSGWMVYLISQQIRKETLKLAEGFKKALSRYLSLAAVWFVVIIFAFGFFKGEGVLFKKYFQEHLLLFGLNSGQMRQIIVYLNFVLTVMINTVFAFAIPAIILDGKGFFKSIIRSFGLMKNLFLPTFILILLPSLLNFPISLMKYNLPRLMIKFSPEVTLLILGLGIVITFVVDSIVLSAVTTLFILNKETEA